LQHPVEGRIAEGQRHRIADHELGASWPALAARFRNHSTGEVGCDHECIGRMQAEVRSGAGTDLEAGARRRNGLERPPAPPAQPTLPEPSRPSVVDRGEPAEAVKDWHSPPPSVRARSLTCDSQERAGRKGGFERLESTEGPDAVPPAWR